MVKHLNPLAAGPYQDTVVWARIFESLTGLNPILLAINVGEDCVNLASKYVAEFVTRGPVQEVLTFYVRDGVKWHDGRAFSVDDVAFSILSIFGAAGREIARRSATTDHLRGSVTNDVEIPSWIDLVKSLDHIELASDRLELDLRSASRYAQEWFGDLPMLPMHVWSKLGRNYLEPTFNGQIGLQHIGSSADATAGYSSWNGLIGADETVRTERRSKLVRFEHYHRGAVQ